MKIALVHDWLTGFRGGEKVLLAILELFGKTDIFTLVHRKGSVPRPIEECRITTSFINVLPFSGTRYQYYLPLMPIAAESFDLSAYDVVISISHCVAKGVITRYDTMHLSYVNAPMRYAYEFYSDYFGRTGFRRAAVAPFMNYLRMWDSATARRPDFFAANSDNIRKRIKKHYRAESQVIYPPVDVDRFKPVSRKDDFYFMLSAFVEYKRLDIAVRAFNELGSKLVIAGRGVMEDKLKRIAKKNIEFAGDISQERAADYYARARAFIFPGEEDFGITPVEAQASGTPVIAFGRGGALETIRGKNASDVQDASNARIMTGLFFEEQTPESLSAAVRKFESMRGEFNPDFIRSNAMKFRKQNFLDNFKTYFDHCLNKFKEGNVC